MIARAQHQPICAGAKQSISPQTTTRQITGDVIFEHTAITQARRKHLEFNPVVHCFLIAAQQQQKRQQQLISGGSRAFSKAPQQEEAEHMGHVTCLCPPALATALLVDAPGFSEARAHVSAPKMAPLDFALFKVCELWRSSGRSLTLPIRFW